MSYTVSSSDAFSYGAETETERILKNCANLLSLTWGEVMGDRTLGLDPRMIDQPVEEVRSELTSHVTEVIEEREPRARVSDVLIETGITGDMEVKVVIGIA